MKIKQISKNLLITLTIALLMLSSLLLFACGKVEEKVISLEKAETLISAAHLKAKEATSICESVYENEEMTYYQYMNGNCAYTCDYENGPNYYQTWTYDDEDETYLVEYVYNTMQEGNRYVLSYETTDLMEYFTSNLSMIELFDEEEGYLTCFNFSGKQTKENEYLLTWNNAEMGTIKILIVDDYITSVVMESEDYTFKATYEYNVSKDIPSLPDINWD